MFDYWFPPSFYSWKCVIWMAFVEVENSREMPGTSSNTCLLSSARLLSSSMCDWVCIEKSSLEATQAGRYSCREMGWCIPMDKNLRGEIWSLQNWCTGAWDRIQEHGVPNLQSLCHSPSIWKPQQQRVPFMSPSYTRTWLATWAAACWLC